MFQILAKVSIRPGSERISHANCSCPTPYRWKRPPLDTSVEQRSAATRDREDGSPVETWELVDVPCRPVVRLEARAETLEPLVHPVDVLGCAFAGDDTLDNFVLLAITSDKSEMRCGGGGVDVDVWRFGGLVVLGVEGYREESSMSAQHPGQPRHHSRPWCRDRERPRWRARRAGPSA